MPQIIVTPAEACEIAREFFVELKKLADRGLLIPYETKRNRKKLANVINDASCALSCEPPTVELCRKAETTLRWIFDVLNDGALFAEDSDESFIAGFADDLAFVGSACSRAIPDSAFLTATN